MSGRTILFCEDRTAYERQGGRLRRLDRYELLNVLLPTTPTVTVTQPVGPQAMFDAVHVAYATPDPEAKP